MFEYLLLLAIGITMYYNTQLSGIQIILILLVSLLIISMFNMVVMESYFPNDGLVDTNDPKLVRTDKCGNPDYITSSPNTPYDQSKNGTLVTGNPHHKMTNLIDLPPSPAQYQASYWAALRGQKYLDADVNVYKSPIDTGHPTDGWDCNSCIKKQEYRRYNHYHDDYNMKGPKSASCSDTSVVLMDAPKNDGVNLFKAPDCDNQDSVSYYSMGRMQ